jgi:hypothetical protein
MVAALAGVARFQRRSNLALTRYEGTKPGKARTSEETIR